MARTKRTATAAASEATDENAVAPRPQLPGAASSLTMACSDSHDNNNAIAARSLKKARVAPTRRSRTTAGHNLDLPFAPHAIDDPIPSPPSADSLDVDPARHVHTLGQITFPDIDAADADRSYWLEFHKARRYYWNRQIATEWCEYPERAEALVADMYANWPPQVEDKDKRGWVKKPKESKREWTQGLEDLMEAKESGVIPEANPADALLFESVIASHAIFKLPPALASFVDDSGKYTGFERAVITQLDQVQIQPLMHVRRATIVERGDGRLTYAYNDPGYMTDPKYHWVTYMYPTVLESAAAFDALTPASFAPLVQADAYHVDAQRAKPARRYLRAPHAYPLPHKDHTIEARVAWIVPPTGPVDDAAAPDGGAEGVRFFTLDESCGNAALLKLIRPEMMPYLCMVIRPIRGQVYDPALPETKVKYRWSVYLKTEVVNEALRGPRIENARQVSVIRDMLRVVGCQAGWITNDNEDERKGPAAPWDYKDPLRNVHFPPLHTALHLQLRDQVFPHRSDILNHICTSVLPDARDQSVLAWLLTRDSERAHRIQGNAPGPIPRHSVRVQHPVVRLGPTGMYYEPLSGLFSETAPTWALAKQLSPPSAPPVLPPCTDSLLQIPHYTRRSFKHKLVHSLIALTPTRMGPMLVDSHLPPDNQLCPATLVLCPRDDVDEWIRHAQHTECGRPLRAVCIHNRDDYVAMTLDQLRTADLVVVSVDFLLRDYQSGLSILSTGCLADQAFLPDSGIHVWTDWKSREYCQGTDAALFAFPDSTSEIEFKTTCVNVASQVNVQDAFATFGPAKHWTNAILPAGSNTDFHAIQSCPVLLHKLYWKRIVFDKVSRATNMIHEDPPGGAFGKLPTMYCYDPTKKSPTPLREFLGQSSVTLFEPTYGHDNGREVSGVFEMVAVDKGDSVRGKVSRRAMAEVVRAVALDATVGGRQYDWAPREQ